MALNFKTTRLLLRQLKEGDAPSIYGYRSLPAVARYQSWESYQLVDAETLVVQQAAVHVGTLGTWIQLAIVETATNSIIGDCGIHFRDTPGQVELGITMDPTYQGRGLATEALKSVLDYLFVQLDKKRVIAVVDAENQTAVDLFNRLGFRQESQEQVWFKDAWSSEVTFAMPASQWNSGH